LQVGISTLDEGSKPHPTGRNSPPKNKKGKEEEKNEGDNHDEEFGCKTRKKGMKKKETISPLSLIAKEGGSTEILSKGAEGWRRFRAGGKKRGDLSRRAEPGPHGEKGGL